MNSIKCGDCLELIKEIPDKSVDLIVTDPPYDISAANKGGSINNVKKLNKSLNDLVVANITNGYDIELFGFFMSKEKKKELNVGRDVDMQLEIIGTPTINTFRDKDTKQIVIKEWEIC